MKRYIMSVFVIILLQPFSLLAIAQRYQLIDLGLSTFTSSEVLSINAKGIVCGYVMDGSTSRIIVVDPSMNKKAIRQENFFSYRLKINNSNIVFGSIACLTEEEGSEEELESYITAEIVFKWQNPFHLVQSLNFKHVGYPFGQKTTADYFKPNVFWDANDLGQILVMDSRAYEDIMSEFKPTSVWLYDNHAFEKIEHPEFESGFKLNNRGEILGCYHTGSALDNNKEAHVSIYNFHTHTNRTLDLQDAMGIDINDLGQVVGTFFHPQEDKMMGFFASSTGESTPINNFLPFAMNNLGQVVGEYMYGPKKNKSAVWENGIFYDLADLTGLRDDRGNIWDSLDSLEAINDKGDIIGNGTINGKKHGFLLRPLYMGLEAQL
ncbi:MAG: DUF3466 family protein [Parachlamydia sp.]|nr:DUF3466 family protein [Parachlamydia sp.]